MPLFEELYTAKTISQNGLPYTKIINTRSARAYTNSEVMLSAAHLGIMVRLRSVPDVILHEDNVIC